MPEKRRREENNYRPKERRRKEDKSRRSWLEELEEIQRKYSDYGKEK